MTLLFVYLFIALFTSFLCSILESGLLSMPISYLKAKSLQGSKSADMMIEMKEDVDRPLSAILSLNTVAHTVGAVGEGTGGSGAGAAYIFKRSGTTWTEEAKIQASDAEAFDQFGFSASISGHYAIVGALGEDTGAVNAGAAYMF